jgi:tRNA pseudouridine55 synthase
MWTLEALQELAGRGERMLDACLLPIETGMAQWPALRVSDAQALRLARGQSVQGASSTPGSVALYDEAGRALGLGEVDGEGRLRPQRLFTWAAALGQPQAAAPARTP